MTTQEKEEALSSSGLPYLLNAMNENGTPGRGRHVKLGTFLCMISTVEFDARAPHH